MSMEEGMLKDLVFPKTFTLNPLAVVFIDVDILILKRKETDWTVRRLFGYATHSIRPFRHQVLSFPFSAWTFCA